MSAYFFYTLFYVLMAGCIVYPPTEFVSAGLTIKVIFASWLGSEGEYFVDYHIRRSVATLFVHSVLPLGYVLGLILLDLIDIEGMLKLQAHTTWLIPIVCSLIGPIYVAYKIFEWSLNNWDTHPIARNLEAYSNNGASWKSVASDINTEYRRIDKISIDTSSVTCVIVTDNWIVKVTPYRILVAHQSDTALVVIKSDTHAMSPASRGEVQFISIVVKPTRQSSETFDIRLNALDFKDLQDKVSRPIVVLQNVTFHKTLLDRFIDTFKDRVAENPEYETAEEMDQCIGCMQVLSNVKLSKRCASLPRHEGPDDCTMCQCRPMWCIECMAKWFASRQDENAPETWLSSKCTCPVCRAKFCLLDVRLVRASERL